MPVSNTTTSQSIASLISGQVAGFDVPGAVDGLLGIRKFEISQLQKQQDGITARQDALLKVNEAISALRTTSTGMADSSTFFGFTASLSSSSATVSASSLVDVGGSAGVVQGQHSIIVSQIAQAQRISSSTAVKDNNGAAINSATIALNLTGSFQLGGVTVAVNSSDSLNDIIANINRLNSGASATGVTASVMKVGNNDFRLIMVADNTGQAGFSLTGSALNSAGTLANLQLGTLASASAVKDSSLTIVGSAATALGLSGVFQVNGTNITVNTTDSLQDIANTITSAVANVSAAVEQAGPTDFRLVLMGDAASPPANQTISVADPNAVLATTLAGLQLSVSSQSNVAASLQQAQDANLSIDGLALTRTSNKITDALQGVTLSLKQADPSVSVNMNVVVDQQALRANVQSFVDSYNSLQKLVNDQFAFDPNTGVGGVLSSEPLLTTIQSSLSSSLLQAVPGLAQDRNSLVMIGVEPDSKGQLVINDSRFNTFLSTDANAIRDVFVAQGSSANSSLQFLTNGLNTPSGDYLINVTQAASKATASGATDLSAGLAANETLTITETGNARQAIVNLTSGQSQSAIIAALNAELSTNYTEQHQFSTALMVSGFPATSAATLASLGLGIAANDTINISGTLRSGVVVSGSFTVLNPSADSVASLLSAIQTTFNQEVAATIDASGKLTLTDTSTGDSQLSASLTANNEGGGSLAFGADTVVTEGRYALAVQAVGSGNTIAIESTSYGASSGFSITQSANGFGMADQTVAGTDVAGTINDLIATGTGQMLRGTAGAVDGLALLYTGTGTGLVGTLNIGRGIAANFDGQLDLFSNPFTGLIQNSMQADQTTFDSLTSKMEELTRQMEAQRVVLTGQFSRMQQVLASLQQSGDFLTAQINAQNARN